MILVLMFFGTIMSLVRSEYIYKFSLIGFVFALFIIGLGAAGLIDRNGILEYYANEFISLISGLPVEELEQMEGSHHEKT